MSKFKCGDRVKLIGTGQVYSSYDSWVRTNAPLYLDLWKRTRNRTGLLAERCSGIVLMSAPHMSYANTTVYLIEFLNVKDLFNDDVLVFEMVDESGLVKIEEET